MITSCVSMSTDSPAMTTPSPGAVCPAIVIYGARIETGVSRRIIPATLNTTIRAPPASQASLKVPGPLSARLVTTYTFPLLPPGCEHATSFGTWKCRDLCLWQRFGNAGPGYVGPPLTGLFSTIGSAFAQASSEWRFTSFMKAAPFSSSSTGIKGYCASIYAGANMKRSKNSFFVLIFIMLRGLFTAYEYFRELLAYRN